MSKPWFYFNNSGAERVCRHCGFHEFVTKLGWTAMWKDQQPCSSCRPAQPEADKPADYVEIIHRLTAERDAARAEVEKWKFIRIQTLPHDERRMVLDAQDEANRLRAEVARLTLRERQGRPEQTGLHLFRLFKDFTFRAVVVDTVDTLDDPLHFGYWVGPLVIHDKKDPAEAQP